MVSFGLRWSGVVVPIPFGMRVSGWVGLEGLSRLEVLRSCSSAVGLSLSLSFFLSSPSSASSMPRNFFVSRLSPLSVSFLFALPSHCPGGTLPGVGWRRSVALMNLRVSPIASGEPRR